MQFQLKELRAVFRVVCGGFVRLSNREPTELTNESLTFYLSLCLTLAVCGLTPHLSMFPPFVFFLLLFQLDARFVRVDQYTDGEQDGRARGPFSIIIMLLCFLKIAN